MKDQAEKLEFLRLHGVSDVLETPCPAQKIGDKCGVGKSTWSAYASRTGGKTLPTKHDRTLGALFQFDPTWPEWRDGSGEDFIARYQREHPTGESEAHQRAERVEAWAHTVIALAGDNLQGMLKEDLETVLTVIRGEDEADEEQIAQDIFRFQEFMAGLTAGEDDAEGRLLRACPALREALEALNARAGEALQPDEVCDEFERLIERALEEASKLLSSDLNDPSLKRALQGLARTLQFLLAKARPVRLGLICHELNNVESRARSLYRTGARALMRCVGLYVARAPDGAVFTDADADWAPEMVIVPAGEFLMGAAAEDDGRETEVPQTPIRFTTRFALGRYAVTFREYDFFCDATSWGHPEDRWGRGRMPVTFVSWDDACAYCEWISRITGANYALPSEAQWEYGCRAASQTPFCQSIGVQYNGKSINTEEVNYDGNYPYRPADEGKYRRQTVLVDHDEFHPNAWGLWQTHGNVWEWCADVWHNSHEGAMLDGSARFQSEAYSRQNLRVIRGGSWRENAAFCFTACRLWSRHNNHDDDIGFRLFRSQVS